MRRSVHLVMLAVDIFLSDARQIKMLSICATPHIQLGYCCLHFPSDVEVSRLFWGQLHVWITEPM